MILFDGHGHMISDSSLDELHAFALKIGLKRSWFQDKRLSHYDLTTERMRRKAELNGAVKVGSRQIVKILKSKKPEVE